ncbi:MAG: ABC transporter ATP-binding protein [Lachnospiraceae bacterium]|nr:ABC transporter ATP-binding protein [Lachnospiraceae bacterium]
MAQELIRLEHISKQFDGQLILDDLDLVIHENEFVTLLGPSGCGKTTTLRIIGGFEKPDSGRVIFEGKDITDLPPYKRQLNTVFQKYALFPHMDVAANIAFGLRMSKKSKNYIDDKIKYALKLVNLDGYEHRSVDSLSGGQQQRIAIARAIVNEPKVLLLDEPLGALDLKMRQDMQYELIRLKKELGITFLYVTHDQEEALTMSDMVVVMNQGYIQQMGTPVEVYNEPECAFVADFIGDSNIIDSVMVKDKLVRIMGREFECVDTGFGLETPVDVVIRPEDVMLVPADDDDPNALNGTVTDIVFKGVFYEVSVMTGDFEWQVNSLDPFEVGKRVRITVDPFDIQIMNKPVSEDEEAIASYD